MPLSLAAIDALLADNTSGDISAADMRSVVAALYDWVPAVEKYKLGRLAGETSHASDDFFATYTGYTEQAPTGTVTWAASRGGLSCKFHSVAAADVAIAVKAVPAGLPLTIETCLGLTIRGENNNGAGLIFTDGTATTSNIAGFGLMSAAGGGVQWSTPSVTVTNATSGLSGAGAGSWAVGQDFIRLIWSAANTFEVAASPDGQTWVDFGNATFARTFTPTHMGFWVTNWNTSGFEQAVTFNYLRVYEADLSV